MPFGLIFGALFYGALCTWVAVGLVLHPGAGARTSGFALLVLGLVLAVGLLRRESWARWAGALFALPLAAWALGRIAEVGKVTDHLMLLGAVATAVLLLVPATGSTGAAPAGRRPGVVLPLVAVTAFLGLVGASWWSGSPAPDRAVAEPGAIPASALAKRIRWVDYGAGIDAAKSSGKPMLVTFVTDWCGFCSKMDRETWREATVIERMGDLIAVRVDAEETLARNGYVGASLARKYGVQGYPTLVLADADGRPLSSASGFLAPSRLLSWIDRTVGSSPAPLSGVSLPGSGP